jgi:hypothetical protein
MDRINIKNWKQFICTVRVLAVLRRENSTNVYISYGSFLPERLSQTYHSIRIVEYHRRNYYP